MDFVLIFAAPRSGYGLVRFPFCFFLSLGIPAVVKFLPSRDGYFAFGDAVPEINLSRNDGHAFLLSLDHQAVNLSPVQQQLSFAERVVIAPPAREIFRYMAIYQPRFAAADLGEGLPKRALPFAKRLDLGADQHDSGFQAVQELVVIGSAAVLRNNLDAGVLILIGVRFCHKTIIASATDTPQVMESGTFPALGKKFNKIVTG